MCYAINLSVYSYIHTSASSRHINCPCFAYTNARNRAKKRQGMKKDYRTSTNHEQWPRLASTHLIILLFGLIGLLFDPGKLSFGPSKPSFGLSKLSFGLSKLSFGGSKQQSFATEKRLFLDLSQKNSFHRFEN